MVQRRKMCALNIMSAGVRNLVTNTLIEYGCTILDTTSSFSNFRFRIHLVEAREVFSDSVSKLVRATFLDHIIKTELLEIGFCGIERYTFLSYFVLETAAALYQSSRSWRYIYP